MIVEEAAYRLTDLQDDARMAIMCDHERSAYNTALFDWLKRSPAHLRALMEIIELERRIRRIDPAAFSNLPRTIDEESPRVASAQEQLGRAVEAVTPDISAASYRTRALVAVGCATVAARNLERGASVVFGPWVPYPRSRSRSHRCASILGERNDLELGPRGHDGARNQGPGGAVCTRQLTMAVAFPGGRPSIHLAGDGKADAIRIRDRGESPAEAMKSRPTTSRCFRPQDISWCCCLSVWRQSNSLSILVPVLITLWRKALHLRCKIGPLRHRHEG